MCIWVVTFSGLELVILWSLSARSSWLKNVLIMFDYTNFLSRISCQLTFSTIISRKRYQSADKDTSPTTGLHRLFPDSYHIIDLNAQHPASLLRFHFPFIMVAFISVTNSSQRKKTMFEAHTFYTEPSDLLTLGRV